MGNEGKIFAVLASLYVTTLLGAQSAPAQMMELWTATATKTPAGPIVNPPKFIEAVRSRIKKAP